MTEELRETIQLFCIQVFVLPRHMISFFEVILLRMNFCVALGGKRSAHESCDSVTATLGGGAGGGRDWR